jgi:hypothetical protein
MVALAVALWALGITLDELQKDHGHQLIVAAILVFAVATILFLGDFLYVASGVAKRAWTRRAPRLQLGKLDYLPEFRKAASMMTTTMKALTAAQTDFSAKNPPKRARLQAEQDPTEKQTLAAEIASDIDVVRFLLEEKIPVLLNSIQIMREATRGILRTTTDIAALTQFRDTQRGLTTTMQGAKKGINNLRAAVHWFRREDLSAALNQSSDRYRKTLGEFNETQGKLVRMSKRSESAAQRQILIRRVRRAVGR